MVDLFQEIDFSQEIKENPQLEEYLKKAAQSIQIEANDLNKPVLDTSTIPLIIVTGLPKVPVEKLKMLNMFLTTKIFAKFGIDQHFKDGSYGFSEDKTMTNGIGVFEFDSPDVARLATDRLNNTAFDKAHTISVYTLPDFENIIQTSESFVAPKIVSKKDLEEWLTKSLYQEQYCVQVLNQTNVNWFDHLESRPVNALPFDSLETTKGEEKFLWSENGSYFVNLCDDGFQMSGGTHFQQLNFFKHEKVKKVVFSSDEKYCISFNGTSLYAPNTENFIVWDVLSGQKLRAFKADANDAWGSFQFSPCSKYIARLHDGIIGVYELPLVGLIPQADGKKTALQIPNVQSFQWFDKTSTLCIISFTTDEKTSKTTHTSSKVSLVEIPSRQETRKWKSLTCQLTKADIISTPHNKWLCLLLQKKVKKQTQTIVHLANLTKKQVEIQDFEFNHKVNSFGVEPLSGKFAFVRDNLEPGSSIVKFDFEFYALDTDKFALTLMQKVPQKTAKTPLFSSNGQFLALVNTDSSHPFRGVIEFWNLKPKEQGYTLELLREQKMNYMSFAEWDPSGKLLMTASQMTKTIMIWNAYGKMLYKDTMTLDLTKVCWRPRPVYIIDEKVEKEINKNYKDYKTKYELSDDKILNKIKYEREAKIKIQKETFLEYISKCKQNWENSRQERIQLLGFDEFNPGNQGYDEVFVDELVLETSEAQQ